MMNADAIHNYWDDRARHDDSVQSTTKDFCLRQIEARVLARWISLFSPNTIADVGCGDGRTTLNLAGRFFSNFDGLDYSDAMIENANGLLARRDLRNVNFAHEDICYPLKKTYDLIYTTRCLINIPTWEHQANALINICNALNYGGAYLMIENFVEGQEAFNEMRLFYGLPAIPIREHNLFFTKQKLLDYTESFFTLFHECNISSSYYLASRIIYARICQDKGVEPDYFDAHHRYASMLPFMGEYGPVRLIIFKKGGSL